MSNKPSRRISPFGARVSAPSPFHPIFPNRPRPLGDDRRRPPGDTPGVRARADRALHAALTLTAPGKLPYSPFFPGKGGVEGKSMRTGVRRDRAPE